MSPRLIAGLLSGSTGLGVIAIVALVAVVAMVLLSRLIRRDPNVRSTKFGWYIEREHYEIERPWPEFPPLPERTIPQWPDKSTDVTDPPKEEKK
jgi:hypothetical protein